MISWDHRGSIHEGYIGVGDSIAYYIYIRDKAIAMELRCSDVLSQLHTQHITEKGWHKGSKAMKGYGIGIGLKSLCQLDLRFMRGCATKKGWHKESIGREAGCDTNRSIYTQLLAAVKGRRKGNEIDCFVSTIPAAGKGRQPGIGSKQDPIGTGNRLCLPRASMGKGRSDLTGYTVCEVRRGEQKEGNGTMSIEDRTDGG
jgi:hypothetical protein